MGSEAVKLAVKGVSGKMVTLNRVSDNPYRCALGVADLAEVANGEKYFPREWITPDGFFVTTEFLSYARPLIKGEVKPVDEGRPARVRALREAFHRQGIGRKRWHTWKRCSAWRARPPPSPAAAG